MRGADDEMTVGERIAFFRVRRGYTQRELGVLVNRTEAWVSSIERGRRQARRIDVLTSVAEALRVGLPELLGQPVLMEDEEGDDDIPALRDALMAPERLSQILFPAPHDGPPPAPSRIARYTEHVWFEYQGGRLGRVVRSLPDLIRTAQRLEEDPGEAGDPLLGWAVSARIHHLASTTLSKIGEVDLAWMAAERSMHAAEQSRNLLALASAARAGTHAFLVNGRYDDALNLGNSAAKWFRSRMQEGDPAALSLFGMLCLRTAIAAARNQDRQETRHLLEQASWAAQALGEDGNYWQTGFGPTNVELHRISAALDLGDIAYVVEYGPRVRADHLPAERIATHRIDTGRAMSLLARDDEAVEHFLAAEQAAAHLVRHSPVVKETVKVIWRRHPVAGGSRSSSLAALAERCRAVTS